MPYHLPLAGGGPYVGAAEDYMKRYRTDVGIEDPSAAAGDYVMFSLDKGHSRTKPRQIAHALTVGYTRLVPTGPDSCLVMSQRLIIPGESESNILRQWEQDWPEWSKRSKRVFEARTITIRR